MSRYQPAQLEAKWQAYWSSHKTFVVRDEKERPRCYVLDMFPYPSGAGLHVGHPLGYVASDVVARYRWALGEQVLRPMGFDAFGLPAEQYALATGQHPAVTTRHHSARYRQQLDQLGLAIDWSRQVTTSTPSYYRWTQWLFLQLFDSWYNRRSARAEPISTLEAYLAAHGNRDLDASCDARTPRFSATAWQGFSVQQRQRLLLHYRLAYLSEATVNWCPALGTILAAEEVQDGLSERGGHPVVRKRMRQWSLRTTAYADRLLQGLAGLDWPAPVKQMQAYWIGRSEGARLRFPLAEAPKDAVEVFTTRPRDLRAGREVASLA